MTRIAALSLALVLAVGTAFAQELKIDPSQVTAKDTLKASLTVPADVTGGGKLTLTWTDSFGRTVAKQTQDVQVSGQKVDISLPLDRDVAMQNFLSAELVVGDKSIKADKKEFIVSPTPSKWDDYAVFMYFKYPFEYTPNLRDCGVNCGQVQGKGTGNRDSSKMWWGNTFRFYCDQIAYSFYASYHSPAYGEQAKDKLLKEAKAAYKKDPTNKECFYRKPCLDDPAARAEAMDAMRKAAKAQGIFEPYFYTTDETGVANLVEAWDFCFCPITLKAMRPWLLKQYGSLENLNKEWGTSFASIDEVTPLTTDEMMQREIQVKQEHGQYPNNLAPWADHRTYMNISFTDSLAEGAKAVREIQPDAKAGIIGAQMPGAFGGYDYWLLSQATDVIEPYNIGNNREIWRSFAPHKPSVITAFGAGEMEPWRVYYQALHGDLGAIIYDDQHKYLDKDGQPTEIGKKVALLWKAMTGGFVKQLNQLERTNDPIAIHYSQPSITAHWMFERRPMGPSFGAAAQNATQGTTQKAKTTWADKGSWHERRESDFLRLRQSMIYLLEDNMLQYRFVSYVQLGDGSFDKMGEKVLILPQSVAMSKAECEAVRRFVASGGTVIADCRLALMDEHCKQLDKGQLDDLFGIERSNMEYAPGMPGLMSVAEGATYKGFPLLPAAEPGVKPAAGATALYKDLTGVPAFIVKEQGKGRTIYLNAVVTDYHRFRMKAGEGDDLRTYVMGVLKQAGIEPQYSVKVADGTPPVGAELHPWSKGSTKVLALARNYGLNVSELGPPEYQKQVYLERPMEMVVELPKEMAVYDMREGKYLGTTKTVKQNLDRLYPIVLTLLPTAVKDMKIEVPAAVKAGEIAQIKLTLDGAAADGAHAFHCRVLNDQQKEVYEYTQNLAAPGGKAVWPIPFALSEAKAAYTLEVNDAATGTKAVQKVTVE